MAESSAEDTRAAREDETFVQHLAAEQFRLLHYITVLLGDPHAASNVLQETNIVLWRKSADFRPGTSFAAWSRQVAYWQVQAYVRDKKRDRHVFSDELLAQLADQRGSERDEAETHIALRHCLAKVSQPNLGLLRARYADDMPIAALAEKVGKTQSAVKVQLMRLRRQLLKCIQRKLPPEFRRADT